MGGGGGGGLERCLTFLQNSFFLLKGQLFALVTFFGFDVGGASKQINKTKFTKKI